MTEQSAEDVAHRRAQAVVTRDFGTALRLMTVDAFSKAMDLGTTNWDYSSYDLKPEGREGDDHIFVVTFEGKQGTLRLRDHFRIVDGTWRLVAIERIE